jgi:CRISPR-associated protein Csy1
MSEEIPTQRTKTAQDAVNAHLAKRRAEALSKIKGSDSASEKRRVDIGNSEAYQLAALVHTAIQSVGQIQLASHLLKPTYPDAKVRTTTNLKVKPSMLPKLLAVGSHVLSDNLAWDATGNGPYVKKIYEIGLLLSVLFEDRSLRDWLTDKDPDVSIALGCVGDNADAVRSILTAVEEDRCPHPASHSRAKQLYWLVETDAHDDRAFHLLAPLYPSLLVHHVYQQLQDDRFGEGAKSARDARKAGTYHARSVREYPQMAIQKLGGTKQQNISNLNRVRRGANYLLASLPPIWKSEDIRPLLRVSSLFKVYGRRRAVAQQARALRLFLRGNPSQNKPTRLQIREWVQSLIDELVQFQAELLTLAPGWSQVEDCDLPAAQRAWLDPDGQAPDAMDQDDATDVVASDFARWVNAQLLDPLPVGDDQYVEWRKLAREQFAAYEREAA